MRYDTVNSHPLKPSLRKSSDPRQYHMSELHNQYAAYHNLVGGPKHEEAATVHLAAADAHLAGHPDAHKTSKIALDKTQRTTAPYNASANADHFRIRAESASRTAHSKTLSTSGPNHRRAAELHRAAAGGNRIHTPRPGTWADSQRINSAKYHTMRAIEHDHLAHIGELSHYANKHQKEHQAHKNVIHAVKRFIDLPHGNPNLKQKTSRLIDRHEKHLSNM